MSLKSFSDSMLDLESGSGQQSVVSMDAAVDVTVVCGEENDEE